MDGGVPAAQGQALGRDVLRVSGHRNTKSRLRGRLERIIERTGGDLLSQALAGQVPSALRGLTALFGMGRGISPVQYPPKTCQDPPHADLQNYTTRQRTGTT